MADSDVHEAIQLKADIDALVSPNVSQLWRAMHGYTAEATGAVAAHRALIGGSASCTLGATHIDVKPLGSHPALWDSLVDNPWDANPLDAIPAGLGLTFSFDGSDATITVAEEGLWAITFICDVTIPDGNAWRATLRDSMRAVTTMPPSWGNGSEMTQTAVYRLPAGAFFDPELLTQVAGDGVVPILADFFLVISRLG